MYDVRMSNSTNPKPPMVRKNFFLSVVQCQKLEALARDTGLSEAELVRRALDRYFVEEGNK